MSKMESHNDDEFRRIKHEPNLSETKDSKDHAEADLGEDEEEFGQEDEEVIDDLQAKIEAIQGGIGETYNPRSEPWPDLPAYRKSFRKTESLCQMVFNQAALVLENSEYSDDFTRRLLQSIKDSQTFHCPEAKKIAFLGDSGVGKSSLINALLDSPYLSPAGSSGGACTCVITEYRFASESQKNPFLAEVEFHGTDQINAMLKEHYLHYYRFYAERPDGLEGDELDVMEAKATTAKEVFSALYADRKEFQDDASAKRFLNSGVSENDKDILEQLLQWSHDMIYRQRGGAQAVCFIADTAEDLSEKLEPFVENRIRLDGEEQGIASYWPLIRLVRVGLRSNLLATGLAIADLPGLSDTNRTRRSVTLQYLYSCAFTVIVAPIQRVSTDLAVHGMIMTALQRPGKSKLLVCTKIDDLDPATTKARGLHQNAAELRRCEMLSKLYKTKKQENLQLTKSIKKLKGKERLEAEKAKEKISTEETMLGSIVLESLVNMRNAKVKRSIKEKYKEISENARTLAICFVSNRDYQMHLEGYTSSQIPLPVPTTGVPKLRYTLSSIPADGKLLALEHYYKGVLRSVIDSMAIWSTQSTFERQKELRKVVEKPKRVIHEIVQAHVHKLKQSLSKTVLQPLAQVSIREWRQHGLNVFIPWNQMHSASFSAFCRKDGVHESRIIPWQDWNQELLKPVKDSVIEFRRRWEEEISDQKESLSATLYGLLDGVRDDLNVIPGVSLLPMTPFLQSLTTKKDLLLKEMSRFYNSIETMNDRAYDIATSSEHDGALMEAMLPLYQKLIDIRGKQVGNLRKAFLKYAIDKGEPFSKYIPILTEYFHKAVDKEGIALSESLGKVFDNVLHDYDFQFVVEELPDERRDALKEEVKDFVRHAEFQYNELIGKQFAEATL